MDYFESIVRTLLEHEGYWVRQSFKVNLPKSQKRALGKPRMPRPEVDLLAYNPAENTVKLVEVKSFLDSAGVRLTLLQEDHETPSGLYKLFTCRKYYEIVSHCLRLQLLDLGLCTKSTQFQLGLVAGNVYRNQSAEIEALFRRQGWFFWSPELVREKVYALAEKGYENEPAIITAKILARQ